MEPRPLLATSALDDPRASVDREVRGYLATVAAAQARMRDELVDATGLLSEEHGHLSEAAALQVRLTQRFFDAQRAVLGLCADTDAKIARVAETAALEAAMVGLDIGGRLAVRRPDASDVELRLQAVLETWWTETHVAGDRAIALTHADASQWVEVAHLAAAEPRDPEPVTEALTEVATIAGPTADEHQPEPATEIAADLLPVELREALTDASHDELDQLLASMLDALPPVGEAATSTDQAHETGDVPQHVSTSTDGFDLFWGNGRLVATDQRRSVVIDAIMPMVVVSLILVAVLVWIG
jgi:hypothetical protein